MTNYDNNWGNQYAQQQSYNFEVPEQFGSELAFQSFDVNQTAPANANYTANTNLGGGSFYDAGVYGTDPTATDGTNYDDEPPLLEELGINPNHILQKVSDIAIFFLFPNTLSVLNPFRTTEPAMLQDADMAGPLVFCLTLGAFLLLSGKVTFSYIYGIGVLGCLAFFALLTLMATQASVTLGSVISVLGYCLLPMVVLSGLNVLITLQGTFGIVIAAICIFWCSISASKLFVTAYSMEHQQILVAYPCALLYGVFALITIF